MPKKVLWVDDIPEELDLFRMNLLRTGLNLDVANSLGEAEHRVANKGYNHIFLRPELKTKGLGYHVERGHEEIPFFRRIYDNIRDSQRNKETPLHLIFRCSWLDDKGRKLRKVMGSEGIDTSYSSSEIITVEGDGLTRIIYIHGIRPADFGEYFDYFTRLK